MVDFSTDPKDLKKGTVGFNHRYYCLIKWPPIARNRDVKEMQQNQAVANAMVKHRTDVEAWCDDNCKEPYKIPDEATTQGIPVMFISRQDWARCCAEWDIVTTQDLAPAKPKGSLSVDAHGNIIIN